MVSTLVSSPSIFLKLPVIPHVFCTISPGIAWKALNYAAWPLA
jgi:hypothetical protein